MASQETLSLRRLKKFQPLNRLTDDQLVLLVNRTERKSYSRGQQVLQRGARDGLDYFLVAGKVELESLDGRKMTIEAETERALNPIARLQPRMYDVTAVAPCQFLVIEQDVLNQLLHAAPVTQVEMDSGESHSENEEHHILMELKAELQSNQLKLPSVSGVAWKVRRMADKENATAELVASAVSADPAISAKLVRACNSPLYRGFSDVRNVREAVIRLGMKTTRQLVTVFSMREVFKSGQPALQKEMEKLWHHSREVAALCWVLADHATGLNPEEALLAGLLHDIGVVPILVQAEHSPSLFANDTNLQSAITEFRADVGAAVLENWAFPSLFVEAVRHAEDWNHESEGAGAQLVDVVIIAQLHAMVASGMHEGLPELDQVPAYQKLGGLELNESRSLELLTKARARVDEVQQLLSIQ